jgi:hypothetical protein
MAAPPEGYGLGLTELNIDFPSFVGSAIFMCRWILVLFARVASCRTTTLDRRSELFIPSSFHCSRPPTSACACQPADLASIITEYPLLPVALIRRCQLWRQTPCSFAPALHPRRSLYSSRCAIPHSARSRYGRNVSSSFFSGGEGSPVNRLLI